MGLDIYMYKYLQKEKTEKLEGDYEKLREEAWDTMANGREYKDIPEVERDAHHAEMKAKAKEMGLDEDGADSEHKQSIEIDSAKYPEHMFKIGYCRSSYNGGGINTVLHDLVGHDLYDIFEHDDDTPYVSQPDWKAVKRNAEEVLEEMDEKLGRIGNYRVFKVDHFNTFDPNKVGEGITDNQSALEAFIATKEKHDKPDSFGNFSNGLGDFYLKEPLKVAAIIAGSTKALLSGARVPCEYVIYEDEDSMTWYRQAIEIVVEMADWVLAQPDPELYYIHWSS